MCKHRPPFPCQPFRGATKAPAIVLGFLLTSYRPSPDIEPDPPLVGSMEVAHAAGVGSPLEATMPPIKASVRSPLRSPLYGPLDDPFGDDDTPVFDPGDALLLEIGDYVLLEGGDKILLEPDGT